MMCGSILAIAVLCGGGFASGEEVPLLAGRDAPVPSKVKTVAAAFPDLARRMTPPVEGVVLLQITLSEAGAPVEIRVLKGQPILDMAAIEAVKQWQYEPTVYDGVARRVVLKTAVEFFLSPKSRERYLTQTVSSGSEDAGLRIYAIRALALTGAGKDLRRALEKAAKDRNEAVASAARAAMPGVAP